MPFDVFSWYAAKPIYTFRTPKNVTAVPSIQCVKNHALLLLDPL